VRYKVVYGGDLAELSQLVNAHLRADWQCQGGVEFFFTEEHNGNGLKYKVNWFMQAMTKTTRRKR
jgi:hypothetical protein